MEDKKTVTSTGISFLGLLQVAFIVLKLCKVITWSWWLVLLPLELEVGLVLFLLLLIVLFKGLLKLLDK